MFPCDILYEGALLGALLNLCAHNLAAHGHTLLWVLLAQVPLGNHHSFEYVWVLLISSDFSAIQHAIQQHLSLVNKIVHLIDSHPLVLAPVHFISSFLSARAGEPLTEGGDSLRLLLEPSADSLPAAFTDLHFSLHCNNLLEQYHPFHPPCTISSRQYFHEIVVRPNRSPNPPSSTTVPPLITAIEFRKPNRRQGSSQSVF